MKKHLLFRVATEFSANNWVAALIEYFYCYGIQFGSCMNYDLGKYEIYAECERDVYLKNCAKITIFINAYQMGFLNGLKEGESREK